MILVKEKKIKAQSIYSLITFDNQDNKIERVVDISICKVAQDNKTYLFLYNSDSEVIRDVYRFINMEKSQSSYNTKYLSLQALKILFIYCELFRINYKEIKFDEALRFKNFLLGRNIYKGSTYQFELSTYRSNQTVNAYFSTYRAFYEFIGIKKSPFHVKKIKSSFVSNYNKNDMKKYKIDLNVNKDTSKVPMYIKVEEFNKILGVIRKNYSIREEIIVRLLYECGLRIGEVLGLTLEDILTTPDEIMNRSFDELGSICLRNRMTDRYFQYAKGCLTVQDYNDYKTNAYNTENVGYEVVNVTINLLSKIEEYINNLFSSISENGINNYKEFALADTVSVTDLLENGNYYIFLNKDSKPLSKNGWNKILRKIFIEAGLRVDIGIRKNNLNHRFRHGLAMYLRRYRNYNEVQIMFELRHRSPGTSGVYFRPDEDDIHTSRLEALKSIYGICPMLKEGL